MRGNEGPFLVILQRDRWESALIFFYIFNAFLLRNNVRVVEQTGGKKV